MNYLERNCIFEHDGRKFESGGAFVSADCIVAYLGENNVLIDWHGRALGTYRITATWNTPRSFVSSCMHQVYATVDGVTYTGRSAGKGMVFNGRKTARRV